MANGEADVTKRTNTIPFSGRYAVLVAVISAIVGGAGGPLLLVKFGANPFRPDAYTATDAALLEQRVVRVETYMDNHLDNHPDVANKFDSRISALEAKLGIIIANQERILNRINK